MKVKLKRTAENAEYREFLKQVERTVDTWPSWKKDGLVFDRAKVLPSDRDDVEIRQSRSPKRWRPSRSPAEVIGPISSWPVQEMRIG